jgi:tRNA U34 5-methylaminomethyl-2-thiouridine-forming methyltransferase MnmC
VGGGYDFTGALRRLENASKLGMLETTVKMEKISLRKTPLAQVKAEEILFGTSTLDIIAQEILRRVGKSHFTLHFIVIIVHKTELES